MSRALALIEANKKVDALIKNFELRVGDYNRDFNKAVNLGVEPCHFAVDPYEVV